MNNEEIKQLDELAARAMQGILSTINSPGAIELYEKLANDNKQGVVFEIAERSYLMAHAMMKKKKMMIHLIKEEK